MTERQARPSRVPWPPLVAVGAIVASLALNALYPLPYLGPPLSDLLFAIGWLALAAVLAIDVAAIHALRKANPTVLPTRGTDHLATGGPFSFTRNPIYLANTILLFGLGLVTGISWFFLFGLLAAFLTQKLAIEAEEQHLEIRFGKRYRDYAKRVRRWI